MVTRNRIGNALAVAAAVVGLVLVATGAGHGDTAPGPPPAAGHVQAPAGPAQVAPPSSDGDG